MQPGYATGNVLMSLLMPTCHKGWSVMRHASQHTSSELVLLYKQNEANQTDPRQPLLTWCVEVRVRDERVIILHTFLLGLMRRHMRVLGLLLDVKVDVVQLYV